MLEGCMCTVQRGVCHKGVCPIITEPIGVNP